MQHVTTGWQSLSDDPLRHILTYVPVHECRRGPGVVSRALRATATSPALCSSGAESTSPLPVVRPSLNWSRTQTSDRLPGRAFELA